MVAKRLTPLVVIVGETASGKSALAMELAKRFNGELICADSWTVYKGFNVGTAKPSQEERQAVVHHILDVVDPAAGFSAPQFQRLAATAINDISQRGRLPILVGGTGLYIDCVIFGYSFLPVSSTGLREELNRLSLVELLDMARHRKLSLDTIDTRNKRRVIRLIENNGAQPTRTTLRENTLVLGVRVPRVDLEAKITTRVDAMLKAGLREEVTGLAERFGWGCEPMKGVGYREWRGYFAGAQSLEATRSKIIKSTLDLAKKQRTWFRRPIYKSSIQWVYEQGQAIDLVTTFLNK